MLPSKLNKYVYITIFIYYIIFILYIYIAPNTNLINKAFTPNIIILHLKCDHMRVLMICYAHNEILYSFIILSQ